MILFSRQHRARMAPRLVAFHEGELPAGAAQTLARHLARCPQCAAELHALDETGRLLREAAPRIAALPEEASRALFARALEESGVLRRRPGRRWQLYAWAAPAVLLVLGSGLAVRDIRAPEPVRTQHLAAAPPAVSPSAAAPVVSGPSPAAGARMGPPAPERAVHPRRAETKRLVRATAPQTKKAAPEAVPLVPSAEFEWRAEPVVDPRIERIELVAEVEPEVPAGKSAPEPEVEVQVTRAEDARPGTARVAAWWRDPTGEWFLKQARVPDEEELIELVLVSLSQERIWGYWKEKTE